MLNKKREAEITLLTDVLKMERSMSCVKPVDYALDGLAHVAGRWDSDEALVHVAYEVFGS